MDVENCLCVSEKVARNSSVGIATRYGLDGPGSNPGGGEVFCNHPDRPWAHTASYTMSTASLSQG